MCSESALGVARKDFGVHTRFDPTTGASVITNNVHDAIKVIRKP